MSFPFFSIIVATHQRPHLLARAIQSIKGQAFDDVEVIVVSDDGSPQTYETAIRQLGDKDVFVKRNGLLGPAASRNIAVGLARGKYTMFLDDDDSHNNGCLSALYGNISALKGDLYYFDFELVNEDRTSENPVIISRQPTSLGNHAPSDLRNGNFIPNNAFTVRTAVAKQFTFDERLRSHEDWDYLISLYESGIEFVHLPFAGVAVHQDRNAHHRNIEAMQSGSLPIDFLHIYRKWPVTSEQQRAHRHQILLDSGVNVPPAWL